MRNSVVDLRFAEEENIEQWIEKKSEDSVMKNRKAALKSLQKFFELKPQPTNQDNKDWGHK